MAQRNYAGLQSADFAAAVERLLPRGLAWGAAAGPTQQGFFATLAGAVAAVHARAGALTEREAWPPTSVELLPDWEAVLGLPDPCLPLTQLVAARQAAVAARLAALGGSDVASFMQLAASLGATITIDVFACFRIGVDSCWTPIRGDQWAYAWAIRQAAAPTFDFQIGLDACWGPIWYVAPTALQCEIQRLAPAHTLPLFVAWSANATGLPVTVQIIGLRVGVDACWALFWQSHTLPAPTPTPIPAAGNFAFAVGPDACWAMLWQPGAPQSTSDLKIGSGACWGPLWYVGATALPPIQRLPPTGSARPSDTSGEFLFDYSLFDSTSLIQ